MSDFRETTLSENLNDNWQIFILLHYFIQHSQIMMYSPYLKMMMMIIIIIKMLFMDEVINGKLWIHVNSWWFIRYSEIK